MAVDMYEKWNRHLPRKNLLVAYFLLVTALNIIFIPGVLWSQHLVQIIFDSKIRNKDNHAQIILDLKDQVIVQNKLDPKLTYQQSYDYFYKAYKSHMDPIVAQFKDQKSS